MPHALPRPARPPRLRPAWHLACLLGIVAVQLVLAPARSINADNTWHFRLARDVLAGRDVYWSGVDANRLFPDLLLGLLALAGFRSFDAWLAVYAALTALALYASTAYLASTLDRHGAGEGSPAARAVPALALLLFVTAFPYYDNWIMVAGNHGGGLPVCLACLGLLFAMNGRERLDPVRGLAFLVGLALVIASNRILLLVFAGPLLGAILATWAVGGRSGATVGRPRLLPALAGLVATAIAAGLAGWSVIADLAWHKLAAPGGLPSTPASGGLAWLAARWAVASAAARNSVAELGFDVVVGLALLAIGLLAGLVRLARGARSPVEENRVILAGTVAGAAAGALAFEFVALDLSGAWQFRFIVLPVALAVVFLAVSLDRAWPAAGRRVPGAVAAALLAALLGTAMAVAAQRAPALARRDEAFARGLALLEARIAAHAPPDRAGLRGLSEYWIAHTVTARSTRLHVDAIEDGGAFRFYSSNAAHLCGAGAFFILHAPGDSPRRAALDALLGAPLAAETLDLPVFPWDLPALPWRATVEVLVYPPDRLRERIIEPGRVEAAKRFPSFHCADSGAGP